MKHKPLGDKIENIIHHHIYDRNLHLSKLYLNPSTRRTIIEALSQDQIKNTITSIEKDLTKNFFDHQK